MNRFIFLLLLTVASLPSYAQVHVTLHMDQRLAGKPFSYNTAAASYMGYTFNMTRLQYYVSEIKLVHDGGIVTPVTDLYLLVDPAIDSSFELGNFDITSLEQIQFALGVDEPHNHLDPSTYPNGHPLAPQNPSMHWGWTSGYRFIALEGYAGADSNSLNHNYQIHTVGDQNYKTFAFDVHGDHYGGNLEIHLRADYEKLLNNLDVSGGMISHSATGASKTLIDNTRAMFSVSELTFVSTPAFSGTFEMAPNPANTRTTIHVGMTGIETISCTVLDLTGHVLFAKKIDGPDQSFVLDTKWPPGMYIVRLASKDKFLAVEKLIIE